MDIIKGSPGWQLQSLYFDSEHLRQETGVSLGPEPCGNGMNPGICDTKRKHKIRLNVYCPNTIHVVIL